MKDSLKGMKDRLNYEEVGGAVLLGVDGVVVKAHGSSNAKALANAILRATEYHQSDLVAMLGDTTRKSIGIQDILIRCRNLGEFFVNVM